jgi:hypothetical protein
MFGAVGNAQAGCGTIWTFNMTDHWMWVTIYDLAKLQHLDWGWVAPHNTRPWHAGGAPTPQSYMCGSYYHVRAQVKPSTDPNAKTPDGPDIFDTEIQINPQLSNWLGMIASVVQMGLTCAAGDEVLCAVKWGLGKGVNMAAFGNESNGSIVCLTTHDGKNYFWVESDGCGNKSAKPGPPPPPAIVISAGTRFGPGQRIQRTHMLVNGVSATEAFLESGQWSTPTPKVVKLHGKDGEFQVIGKGKGIIVFTYKGKTHEASFISE